MNSNTRRARVSALTLSIIAVIAAFAAQPSFAKAGDLKLTGSFAAKGADYPLRYLDSPVPSPDGRFVFARYNGDILTLRKGANGALTQVATFDAPDRVNRLAVSPDGRNLYASTDESREISALSIDKNTGALKFLGQFDSHIGQEMWQVTVSPDGKNVYAATSTGSDFTPAADGLAVFSRNPATGALKQIQRFQPGKLKELAYASQMAVSRDGKNLYLAGKSLLVFTRDSAGKLRLEQDVKDGRGGFKGLASPEYVTVSRDGKHVYATGGENATAVMSRGKYGRLKFAELEFFPGFTPKGKRSAGIGSVELSPNGQRAYVAGGGGMAVYTVAKSSGELKLRQQITRTDMGVLKGIDGLVASPVGRTVYAETPTGLAIFN